MITDKNIRGFYLREPSKTGQKKGFPIAYVASVKRGENILYAVCTLSNKDRGAEKYQRTATRDRAIGRLLSNGEKVRFVPMGPDVKLRIVTRIAEGVDLFGDDKPLYPKQTIKAAKSWLKAREEHGRQQ